MDIKKTTSVAVRVDINGGITPELIGVIFSPLRGAEQHGLFAVPGAIFDGPLGLPSLLEQLRESSSLLQKRNLGGNWILGSIDPCVMVVAADDPLVRRFRTGNCEDHVVDG